MAVAVTVLLKNAIRTWCGRDVREGKVSLERARGVYKVVVDTQSWTVDEAETEKLRSDEVISGEGDSDHGA